MERAAISIMRTGAYSPDRSLQLPHHPEDGAEGVLQINKLLVGLKRLAEDHDCAVILCAHPTKMYRAPDGKVLALVVTMSLARRRSSTLLLRASLLTVRVMACQSFDAGRLASHGLVLLVIAIWLSIH